MFHPLGVISTQLGSHKSEAKLDEHLSALQDDYLERKVGNTHIAALKLFHWELESSTGRP